ncbi:MAG: hypothetical protein GF401_17230, partial [Chitinivibrionales bacterium]|nr:hypothetical protein [Chitinivibrionales bacterium]
MKRAILPALTGCGIAVILWSGCLEENPQAPSQPKLIDSTWATFFLADSTGTRVDTTLSETLDTTIGVDSFYAAAKYQVISTAVDSIYEQWKVSDSLFYDRGYFARDTFFLGYDTITRILKESSVLESSWIDISFTLQSLSIDTIDTPDLAGTPTTYYVTSRLMDAIIQKLTATYTMDAVSGSTHVDTQRQTIDTLEVVEKDSVRSTAIKIMPLGNSITSGDTYYNSYRRPLWHMLDSAGYEVDFVGTLTENFRGPPPNPDFDMDHEG